MATSYLILKRLLLVAGLGSSLVSGLAVASEPPEKVGATREVIAPPGRGLVSKPAKPVQPVKPVKPARPAPRRSVPQILDSVPSAARPVGVQPIALPAQHAIPNPATHPAPSTFIPNGCHGGGCADASGTRYQGGIGTTLIGPEGRLCSHTGVTVQCF